MTSPMDWDVQTNVKDALTSSFDKWLKPFSKRLDTLNKAPKLSEADKAKNAEIKAKGEELSALKVASDKLLKRKKEISAECKVAIVKYRELNQKLKVSLADKQKKEKIKDDLESNIDNLFDDDSDDGAEVTDFTEDNDDDIRDAERAFEDAKALTNKLKEQCGTARAKAKKLRIVKSEISEQVETCKKESTALICELEALNETAGNKTKACADNDVARMCMVSKIVKGTMLHALIANTVSDFEFDKTDLRLFEKLTRVDLIVRAVRKECALDVAKATEDDITTKKNAIVASHAPQENGNKRKRGAFDSDDDDEESDKDDEDSDEEPVKKKKKKQVDDFNMVNGLLSR